MHRNFLMILTGLCFGAVLTFLPPSKATDKPRIHEPPQTTLTPWRAISGDSTLVVDNQKDKMPASQDPNEGHRPPPVVEPPKPVTADDGEGRGGRIRQFISRLIHRRHGGEGRFQGLRGCRGGRCGG